MVGDRIRIIKMDDCNGKDIQARDYAGRVGTITAKDDIGQLHGTWGGLAVNPAVDDFEILN